MKEKGSVLLKDYPVFHGGRKKVFDPELKTYIFAQTAVRYMRFLRPVRIDFLELTCVNDPHICARRIPTVPSHPAHLLISIFNDRKKKWEVIKDVQLPENEKFKGKGLSQKMSVSEMDEFFQQATCQQKPYIIQLDGLRTQHLKVECDREHKVWPNHCETAGPPFNVPFWILKPLRAFGSLEGEERQPIYYPILKKGKISPQAAGMRVRQRPHLVYYESKNLAVGFSLVRPTLLHLGWDYFGEGKAAVNRLAATRRNTQDTAVTGPLLRTLEYDLPGYLWSGEVAVTGNRVEYRGLSFQDKLKIDIVFTVNPDSLTIELHQDCRQDIMALEYEVWRFLWDMTAGMTAVAGMPVLRDGRNTFVHSPAIIAGDGIGCLFCCFVKDSPGCSFLQTESWRPVGRRSFGFTLAKPTPDGCCLIIPSGKKKAVCELKIANLEPETKRKKIPNGIRKAWSSIYTSFRPELGGFSNNSISTTCHVNQWAAAEISVFTRKLEACPAPVELFRYTIERALLNGGGFGYHRQLYLDSDPVLVCGAGTIYRATQEKAWLKRIEPGLTGAVLRMLANIDKKTGLVICRSLSGNSNSYRWSSNAMDVVGFGHIDAYVNGWTYRALRNAAVILRKCGKNLLAGECRVAAELIKASYGPTLINPATGWVAGWKSRDGQLHDFAFTWVNGVACAFGLLDTSLARKALENLETLRKKVSPYSYFGVPANLLPIDRKDHILGQEGLLPTFEYYTDGSMGACFSPYYLRALSIYGLKQEAKELAESLLQAFADGVFHGGWLTGTEFKGWEGMDCGYEGTFGPSFAVLYAIAVEKKIIAAPVPEWWPPED